MRKYLLITIISLLLINCKKKKSETKDLKINSTEKIEAKSKNENDTIYNYWQIILDTTIIKKDFKYLNKDYKLKMKTFSLNDSAIVRNLGGKYLDHSHTMITDLTISSDSLKVKRRIDKTDFKKSLNENFYQNCNLITTIIDSIKEKQIFLKTELNVPDTDNNWKVEYILELSDKNLDKMSITKTEYVGI